MGRDSNDDHQLRQLTVFCFRRNISGKAPAELEMPKDRKKAHLARGAVLTLLGLYGLVQLIQTVG